MIFPFPIRFLYLSHSRFQRCLAKKTQTIGKNLWGFRGKIKLLKVIFIFLNVYFPLFDIQQLHEKCRRKLNLFLVYFFLLGHYLDGMPKRSHFQFDEGGKFAFKWKCHEWKRRYENGKVFFIPTIEFSLGVSEELLVYRWIFFSHTRRGREITFEKNILFIALFALFSFLSTEKKFTYSFCHHHHIVKGSHKSSAYQSFLPLFSSAILSCCCFNSHV